VVVSRFAEVWDNAYLWEVHQHFSHLIPSLSASHIDDDVAVREFGHRLADDGLSAAESARYTHSTTLYTGEEGVQHTLSDNERRVRWQFFVDWSGYSNGPCVHHAVFCLLAIELNLQDLLINRIASFLSNVCYGPSCAWWQEDLVVVQQTVFKDTSVYISSCDVIAHLHRWLEIEFYFSVQ